MTYENILLERRESVAIITLNRPGKLNSLSFPLVSELDKAITELEEDDTTRAIVVTGAGDRAFSAGADIHEMAGLSEEEMASRGSLRNRQVWHLAMCSKPTIGAINGLAYGGAALLSSTLDMRIGCERTRFRFLGAAYGRTNSTWTLPLLVGLPMAKELLFTARVVEAEEALRIGLLNRLVPAERLMEEAVEMGQMIAQNDPVVVQGIKRLVHEDIGLSWEEMMRHERDAVRGDLKPPPPREGFREFLERKEG